MPYAEDTTVSVERSQAEVQQTVRRYGADGFVSGWQGDKQLIEFFAQSRRVRFILQVPMDVEEFRTINGRRRTDQQAKAAMEKEHRRRWRAFALVIKAKLEAVESGITTFEEEFLAQIVIPGGKTVAEHISPQIEAAYTAGRVSSGLLQIES